MTESDARKIHEASLELLENPGIAIEDELVARLLLKNGAKPGSSTDVLRIPKRLVEETLELCPSRFPLTDRQGGAATLSSGSEPLFWSCPGLNLCQNGIVTPFESSDMARIARLLDNLESVHAVFGMAMSDIKPSHVDVVGLSTIAKNSSKHIRAFCTSPEGGRTMTEIKQVVGDHPWFSIGFTAHGPLRWTKLALSIFRATSGAGIPVSVNGEPMAGTSGPVTLAGSAAVGNAEILAGIVAIQLMEPGRPTIYNLGLAHTFDMKTMIAVTGGPENHLLADASAAIGRLYGLPSASWVSTEAMIPDSQAALEKSIGFYTHIAGGVSNIWGVGQLESEMTISPAQAVIDDEIIRYIKRFNRQVEVTDESLAIDLVREVGISGSFLDRLHTAENFQGELFMPSVLNRQKRAPWDEAGRKRLDERAEEIADKMMLSEVDNGLNVDQEQEIDRIVSNFKESI